MTTEIREAIQDANRAAGVGPEEGLLERLADRVGAHASIRAVFGEPIVRGDLTIVPVARIRWGFGGGGGHTDDSPTGAASGHGGGGGVAADPIGYLEIDAGGATFQPISDPYPRPAFLIATGVTAALVIRALARLVRG
jgi:uncharacterized spore protein YtfJ